LKAPRHLRWLLPLTLLIWIAGIIFPFQWPARLSAAYSQTFHTVFFAPWTHEVTHFVLYGILGALLSWWLGRTSWPVALRHPHLLLVAVLVGVALLQEGLQLASSARGPGAPELLDWAVDLAGAGAGAGAIWLLRTIAISRPG